MCGCFTSNFPLSHLKQRRAHLCSNLIHGNPTTKTEPLFLFSNAGCHATTPNIPSASKIRNGRNSSTSTLMRSRNSLLRSIPREDAPPKTRPRSCAPSSFLYFSSTKHLPGPALPPGSGMSFRPPPLLPSLSAAPARRTFLNDYCLQHLKIRGRDHFSFLDHAHWHPHPSGCKIQGCQSVCGLILGSIKNQGISIC